MPELIVPCGVAIVLWNGNGLLLGKRKGAHGAGQWAFPGGRLSPNEDPKGCMVRELYEETGIVMSPYQIDLCSIPYNCTVTGGQSWVTLMFWGGTDQDPELREPDKCEYWDFFLPEDIPSHLFGATADIINRMRLKDL